MSGHDGCQGGSVLFAFILGAITGAAVAALLSPDSGAENRRKLSVLKNELLDKADGMVGDAAQKLGEAGESVEESVTKGKEYIDEQKSILKSAIEAGRDAYNREKESHQADEA